MLTFHLTDIFLSFVYEVSNECWDCAFDVLFSATLLSQRWRHVDIINFSICRSSAFILPQYDIISLAGWAYHIVRSLGVRLDVNQGGTNCKHCTLCPSNEPLSQNQKPGYCDLLFWPKSN